MLTIQYVSVVDWRCCSDIIRANPSFYGAPRFDHALIKVASNDARVQAEEIDEGIFCRLLGFFEFTYNDIIYKTALALPLDAAPAAGPTRRSRDRDLRLIRLQPRARSAAVLIDVNTIIRGGLLAEDYESNSEERIVVPFIDQDMWLRLKSLSLKRNVSF